MKVNILSRKLVKPCKPTPPHLSTYKISLMDELNSPVHVFRILYYPSNAVQGKNIACLEESLAQVLPRFYPLAGRYNKEKHQVDCNDEGAEYSTAEVDCHLDQLMATEVDPEQLNSLLAVDIVDADEPTDPMLAVQINRFQCGGLAMGVCASHRIFDSGSLGLFLTAWANSATGRGLVICPSFDSPSYFPSENLPPIRSQLVKRPRDKSIVCKRYVFDKNAISRLRERLSTIWKSSTGSEHPPSRVAVVSTVLTQALMRADRAKHGKSRATLIVQEINIRERTVPPVSKHACGTWVAISHLELNANESKANAMDQNFPGMALKMRETVVKGVKGCPRILSDKAYGRWALVDGYFETAQKADNPDYKVIWVTDWSKFGDYEVDFGFGKAAWVGLANTPLTDLFILMNTKNNDGIEAWVYLDESDMPFFQQDVQFRMLACYLRAFL